MPKSAMSKAGNILFGTLLILILALLPLSGFADDRGAVCLGPNLMFVPYTAEEHVSLTVDDSAQVAFFSHREQPRIVISDLDLKKIHTVKVYHQGKVIDSWQLDFRKFKTKLVQIWRSPGMWRMRDACGGACGSALKCR
jgi:hypothetical protein